MSRESACAVTDGFVGDAGDFGGQEFVGEGGEGSEVEVGKENQAFAEVDVFFFDWFFDFDDHVSVAPDVVRCANDFGACGLVFVVGEGGEVAGLGLHQDGVACVY